MMNNRLSVNKAGSTKKAVVTMALAALVMAATVSGGVAGIDDLDAVNDVEAKADAIAGGSGGIEAGDLVPSRVVVGFTSGIPVPLPEFVTAAGGVVVMEEPGLGFIVVSIDPDRNGPLLDAAQADPRVEYAELDSYRTIQHVPNDLLWSSQWGSRAINLPDAWAITLGSHDVNLHILDTGIDHTHLELLPNLSPQCDGLTSPGATAIGIPVPGGQESGVHGTHVAGIAGAVIDNTLGIAGTSQSCMTSVQVLVVEAGFDTWVAAGIRWSADNGADVISMSLGGPSSTGALLSAVRYADAQGVLQVAAAGNDDCAGGSGNIGFPAAYDEVMSVASFRFGGSASPFSSCGPENEISAPGTGIWSTLPGNTYGSLSGTSMATPYVTGVAGLVWAANATMTHTEVRCILTATASGTSHNNQFGWGRLDAFAAVTAAQDPVQAAKDPNVLDTSLGVCPSGIFEEEAGPVFDPGHAYVDVGNTRVFNEGLDLPVPAEVLQSGSFVVEDDAHGLVIPPSVPPIEAESITFRSGADGHLIVHAGLAAEADVVLVGGHLLDLDGIEAVAGGKMDLESAGMLRAGEAQLAGGALHVSAQDAVHLAGAGLTSDADRVFVSGGDIDASGSTIQGHSAARVMAAGDLDLAAALLSANDGNVRVDAGGTLSP